MSIEVIFGILVLFTVVFLLSKHIRKSKEKQPTDNPGVGGSQPDDTTPRSKD